MHRPAVPHILMSVSGPLSPSCVSPCCVSSRLSTPPPSVFGPGLQVYQLLKQHLSKYVLAMTVDEPASIPVPPTEIAEDNDKDKAAGSAGAERAAATATVAAGDKRDGGAPETIDGAPAADEPTAASPLQKKKKTTGDGENGGDTPAVQKTTEKGAAVEETAVEETADKTAEETAEKTGAVAVVAKKPNPNGPKCVQLKMKPHWRRTGGKRRRGDLDRDSGGGRGGGRWAWPEDRPEYCRFVLYKENSDTVSGTGGVCVGRRHLVHRLVLLTQPIPSVTTAATK